ncbi:hypothetical protein GX586_06065 [bacterium]|nr:hypothetical protein [bacterium]
MNARHIGLWCLAAAVGVHALFLLLVRVAPSPQGSWAVRPALVLMTLPHEARVLARAAPRPAAPDTMGNHRLWLEEPPMTPPSTEPVRLAPWPGGEGTGVRTATGARGSLTATVPAQGGRWAVRLDPALARHAHTMAPLSSPAPDGVPLRPALLCVQLDAGGIARAIAVARSSGDPRFDRAARAMAERMLAAAGAVLPDDGAASGRTAAAWLSITFEKTR